MQYIFCEVAFRFLEAMSKCDKSLAKRHFKQGFSFTWQCSEASEVSTTRQASDLDLQQPLIYNFSLSLGIWLVQGMVPNIGSDRFEVCKV